MSSSSNYLATVRVVTFATTIVFSTIVVCLSAHLMIFASFAGYLILPISASMFTIFTVIPMYVIGMFRQGSIFSRIAFEIGWLSVLWVLWLSTASLLVWVDTSLTSGPGQSRCSFEFFDDLGHLQVCNETNATAAFSFLLWFLLMAYTILLLVLSMRAHQQGRPAWTAAVRDGVLLYSRISGDKTVGSRSQVVATLPTIHQSHPPPSQQSFP